MQNTRENLHLIWADKIALTLAVLTLLFAGFVWIFVALAAGLLGANHVLASVGIEGALESAVALTALWAALRALDYAFGGSTFKLFRGPAQMAEIATMPVSGNLLAH